MPMGELPKADCQPFNPGLHRDRFAISAAMS
jgi:hypothetical protein